MPCVYVLVGWVCYFSQPAIIIKMKRKQLIPKKELPQAREWFKKNEGGWKEYLKQRGLNQYGYLSRVR